MTTYTATRYAELIRTGSLALPLGYATRDDGDGGMYPRDAPTPDGALEALYEALYDAADRATDQMSASVYPCVQLEITDKNTVEWVAAGCLSSDDSAVGDALWEQEELSDEVTEHIADVLHAYLNDPAHPLRIARDAYMAAVKAALVTASEGCWTVGNDSVRMDKPTLEELFGAETEAKEKA